MIITSIFIRGGQRETGHRRRGGDVTREAEIGMMSPVLAKDSQKPPEAERGKEKILPWSLQRNQPAVILALAQ